MAGKPGISKSTAPSYARVAPSTKGVKVGVNNNSAKPNVPTLKKGGSIKPVKGGMVGKTAPLMKKGGMVGKKKC